MFSVFEITMWSFYGLFIGVIVAHFLYHRRRLDLEITAVAIAGAIAGGVAGTVLSHDVELWPIPGTFDLLSTLTAIAGSIALLYIDWAVRLRHQPNRGRRVPRWRQGPHA